MHYLKTPLFHYALLQKAEPNSLLISKFDWELTIVVENLHLVYLNPIPHFKERHKMEVKKFIYLSFLTKMDQTTDEFTIIFQN